MTLDRNATDWRMSAECAKPEVDPEIFFPEGPEDTAKAKEVCRRCPVIEQCGQFALTHLVGGGIFAGMGVKARSKARTRLGITPKEFYKIPDYIPEDSYLED
ncbi:hypothetical protein NCPPB3778_55 [Rathayibacter phage NCPPB3778]|nr:hypothetical protein NCPPB3778_55 [Rathayibacter phage NCPPB3778]